MVLYHVLPLLQPIFTRAHPRVDPLPEGHDGLTINLYNLQRWPQPLPRILQPGA
jgi:hypothetical protein